jgi:hypothetical protein
VSLSDPTVGSLLNRYYVPVYVSNEDYEPNGTASTFEKTELRRIFNEGYAAKMSVGSVHVYVINPEGHLIDSMHVAEAAQAPKLIGMLERNAKKLGTPAGEPVLKPASPAPPKTEMNALLLHLTARYLERKGNDFVPIESSSGDWTALPSEDWITLKPEAWAKLLPVDAPRVGMTWEVEKEVAASLLTHFYPPTENWDLHTNRMDEQALRATVDEVKNGVAEIRLTGRLKMKHSFYHKEDANFAQANVLGYLQVETGKRRIRSLRMVTEQASYGDDRRQLPYGVAVESRQ